MTVEYRCPNGHIQRLPEQTTAMVRCPRCPLFMRPVTQLRGVEPPPVRPVPPNRAA